MPGTLKTATGSNEVNTPGALGFENYNGSVVQRKILMPWGTNIDGNPPTSDWAVSTDGGSTFGTTQTSPDLGVRAQIKTRAGTLLAYNFIWSSQPTNHSMIFGYNSSTDGAGTWTTRTALVDFGVANPCNSMHFHRDMLEENDGSLYAIGYANFTTAGSTGWREVMIQSTDGGANWSYLSTIAYSSTLDFTEATFARCSDGKWITIMKTTVRSSGANDVLRYIKSTNQGVGWIGSAAALPGMTTAFGVDPELHLMPNNILVLSWGPPNADPAGSRDLHVAFSTDGNGTTWSNETTVFTSTRWHPGDTIDSTHYESSGYTAIPAVTAHRFLHLSDTGSSWSYDATIPSPNPFSVRGRFVDIVRTNEINRIDLAGLYAVVGSPMISTDLTYTDSASQESRPTGAFDGSNDYWSGAFKSATTGSYMIDLQKIWKINKIGVSLKHNTSGVGHGRTLDERHVMDQRQNVYECDAPRTRLLRSHADGRSLCAGDHYWGDQSRQSERNRTLYDDGYFREQCVWLGASRLYLAQCGILGDRCDYPAAHPVIRASEPSSCTTARRERSRRVRRRPPRPRARRWNFSTVQRRLRPMAVTNS